jgi:tRNA G18 (ribose-2'-O)-methylase SpoU
MRSRNKTTPDVSLTSSSHQAAIQDAEHFRRWERNVADHLKDKSEEEIRQLLRATQHSFAVLMEHLIGDFNFGTVVRNANAFNAREVFYLGDKKWDRRSAVGVHHYTPVQWLPTLDSLIKLRDQYVLVGVDNVPGAIPLRGYQWPDNALMLFGEEGVGLTPTCLSLCQDVVGIEMYGSVRSLNCGVASGIVMHDFVEKHSKNRATIPSSVP